MAAPGDGLFTTPEMAAVFSPEAHVERMLVFEAALARAEARAGVIPPGAAEAIVAGCRITLFDVAALQGEAATAGTLAIPLVRMLTERVAEEARGYVHWGATSQDAIDTALILQMREGLRLLEDDLLRICALCAELATRHRDTLMAGRTLLQQALPITFGLKAARWLALTTRQIHALRKHRERSLAVQFGGAAGTLASLGDAGVRVAEFLAEELELPQPDLPWHAERDRVAAVAAALGITAGAMAKIAGDLALLAQTEVAETAGAAAPGKGGSSTLPQKRNPVDAVAALASSRLVLGLVPVVLGAMVQEHERAVGGWQAEWAAIPALFRHTAGAVIHVRGALDGLEIDASRMWTNLTSSGGYLMAESLAMALAAHLGRSAAQRIIQDISAQALAAGATLRQAALGDAQVCAILPPEAIEQALDPAGYLGSTGVFIDRALESYRALQAGQ